AAPAPAARGLARLYLREGGHQAGPVPQHLRPISAGRTWERRRSPDVNLDGAVGGISPALGHAIAGVTVAPAERRRRRLDSDDLRPGRPPCGARITPEPLAQRPGPLLRRLHVAG